MGTTIGAGNAGACETLARVRGSCAFAPGELAWARQLYDTMLPEYHAALERLRDTHDPVPAAATVVTAFTTVCHGLVDELRGAGENAAPFAQEIYELHADLVALEQRVGAAMAEANEAGSSLKGARELKDAIRRGRAGQDTQHPVPSWIMDACFRAHPTE
jgi:hypothetical protein